MQRVAMHSLAVVRAELCSDQSEIFCCARMQLYCFRKSQPRGLHFAQSVNLINDVNPSLLRTLFPGEKVQYCARAA